MISGEEAATIVRRYLDGRKFAYDLTFKVVTDHVQTGDNWLRVTITPAFWPHRLFPIFEELAHMEEEISNNEGVNIFLLVGDPEDWAKKQLEANALALAPA